MNEIITNTSNQTPIEIALGIDEEGMTTVKRLFDFLGMSRNNYSRWYKTNITDNQFAEEGIDYFPFLINEECGGQASYDCKITANFAKKLSMQSKTTKGEQARQYFLKVEDKLKETVSRTVPMSPLEQLQLQAQAILQVNEKVEALDKKIERFELDLPILPIEADRITEAVRKRGVDILGGKGGKFKWILLALIVLCAIGAATGGSNSNSNTKSTDSTSSKKEDTPKEYTSVSVNDMMADLDNNAMGAY